MIMFNFFVKWVSRLLLLEINTCSNESHNFLDFSTTQSGIRWSRFDFGVRKCSAIYGIIMKLNNIIN